MIWIAIALLLTLSLPSCSDEENQIYPEKETQSKTEIVNRTDCGTFWRYDFNYETVDTDGKTPITLSAAIFMTRNIHEKRVKAKGCGLINHYTITADWQRPTNVTSGLTLEGILTNTNYILIESDGYGFGMDAQGNQHYLQGRATARVNIDAFLAGRKLMKWRLLRHVCALPVPGRREHITISRGSATYSQWHDRRRRIQSEERGHLQCRLSALPVRTVRYQRARHRLHQRFHLRPLWYPQRQARHDRQDCDSGILRRSKRANGYTAFDIDDSSKLMHTDTGTLYALKALACIGSIVPAGQ